MESSEYLPCDREPIVFSLREIPPELMSISNEGMLTTSASQRTVTMFVRVVVPRYQHYIECHNSHKHSQAPYTSLLTTQVCNYCCDIIININQTFFIRSTR